ncbi:unnamed protein product [Rangifer tarandus platyrhynchus]|uniref:Uncharacterized protein n=1 Tax=Rangifer tarandus platyrhynchus TaxID=3082113 RepID=A0AC59ZYU0_RANTA
MPSVRAARAHPPATPGPDWSSRLRAFEVAERLEPSLCAGHTLGVLETKLFLEFSFFFLETDTHAENRRMEAEVISFFVSKMPLLHVPLALIDHGMINIGSKLPVRRRINSMEKSQHLAVKQLSKAHPAGNPDDSRLECLILLHLL